MMFFCLLFDAVFGIPAAIRSQDSMDIKEAWACMSHIVLEGRRKTRMDNVITVHAKSVEPLYILIHGLKISYVLKYKEA